MFLGGYRDLSLISNMTRVRAGFSGCVRRFQVNAKLFDMRKATHVGDALYGIDVGKIYVVMELVKSLKSPITIVTRRRQFWPTSGFTAQRAMGVAKVIKKGDAVTFEGESVKHRSRLSKMSFFTRTGMERLYLATYDEKIISSNFVLKCTLWNCLLQPGKQRRKKRASKLCY